MSVLYPFGPAAEQAGGLASPRRRQHPGQPPSLLTTSLANAQSLGQGHGLGGQTPLSTNSLSTPFAYNGSPYPVSPAGAVYGPSPMASRSATAFSGQYNPQQWGPISSQDNSPFAEAGSSFAAIRPQHLPIRTTTFAARPIGPDEPVASPPPPYSPQRTDDSQRRNSAIVSPADTMSPGTDSSYGGTPTSAATTISPGTMFPKPGRRSPNSLTAYNTPSPLSNQHSAFPPPPSAARARASSKNHADRILSAMNLKNRNVNSSPPVNAIDALHEHTAQALAGRREAPRFDQAFQPPAARRAASTGAIGLSGYSSRSSTDIASPTRGATGMYIPPPPPGPPPTSTRSQSLCRSSEQSSVIPTSTTGRRSRHHPGRTSTLDTVPPTPADWREDGIEGQSAMPTGSAWPKALHIDTNSAFSQNHAAQGSSEVMSGVDSSASSHVRSQSSGGTLLRSSAVRNRSAKGIRERRSESRTGRRDMEDSDKRLSIMSLSTESPGDVRPGDLVLPLGSGDLSRRRMSSRLTPRSAKNFAGLDETLQSASAKSLSDQAERFASSQTTPTLQRSPYQNSVTPTPPFSPGVGGNSKQTTGTQVDTHLPSKALPTPPLQPRSAGPKPTSLASVHDLRPVSSLLHIPNPDVPIDVMPLSPDSFQSLIEVDGPESPKAFAHRAIDRYRLFAEREVACSNDSERLHEFCQFMVAESRIRRQQYASVFDQEGLEPTDLTEGMFELVNTKLDRQTSQPVTQKTEETSRRSSGTSFSESRSRGASTTATSEPVLTINTSCVTQNHRDSVRWNDYVPCLSPIASMSAVTGRDEDSRGRAPSRWWESQSGASNDEDGFRVLGRTKRESRYMALPQEARHSPAMFESTGPSSGSDQYLSGDSYSRQSAFGPDEYPPEKTGWHEEQVLPPPPPNPPTPMSAPFTPDPRKLDISRLITLPPPFPRHHPAVNNSHPDLADVRATVRSLNELDEATTSREAYQTRVHEKRLRADSWCKHQRSLHSQDVQYRMEHGVISQEEFDQAEADIEAKEAQSKKELVQAEFDLFQSDVVAPLHALFSERITKATASFDLLASRLSSDAQSHSPNLPQEEGDEQPELLEKLTQLKWLYEARENLHRETYNLLSERNDKYKAIVLLPYMQSHSTHNADKKADAESFFAKDALDRRVAYDKAVLTRAESFLAIIEAHVTRGVEIQISAFWDIAPGLLSLLQQVPNRDRLPSFDVLIPRAEVDENPGYWTHPLRYLYSLLNHAESSSRQFIESQISLWCLLQEVREGVSSAKWRVEESGAAAEGRELGWQGEQMKVGQQRALVEDLKEKVGVVEGQWEEALGKEVRRVRGVVREWLEETGGWDEDLDE